MDEIFFTRNSHRARKGSSHIIINIGEYNFRIEDGLDITGRGLFRAGREHIIYVETPSNADGEELRKVQDDEHVEEVLEETIRKFCPYHLACQDLLFSEDRLYLFSLKREEHETALHQHVALIAWPNPTNPTKLTVKYYVPSTGKFEKEERPVSSEITPEEVRAWIEGILDRINRS